MKKAWKLTVGISKKTGLSPVYVFLFLNTLLFAIIGAVGALVYELTTGVTCFTHGQAYALSCGYSGIGIGLFGGAFFLLRKDTTDINDAKKK